MSLLLQVLYFTNIDDLFYSSQHNIVCLQRMNLFLISFSNTSWFWVDHETKIVHQPTFTDHTINWKTRLLHLHLLLVFFYILSYPKSLKQHEQKLSSFFTFFLMHYLPCLTNWGRLEFLAVIIHVLIFYFFLNSICNIHVCVHIE